MMDTFEAIRTRRSIKKFTAGYQLPQADIEKLFELAQLSPSSFNLQHCRYVCVSDSERKRQFREAAWGQPQVEDCSLLIVICARTDAWRVAEETLGDMPPEVLENRKGQIAGFYEPRPELQRDEALRSTGIAAQTLMLAARAMGYDTCPMIGFDPERVAGLIDLPENHIIGMMLPVGKAAEPASVRGPRLPRERVVLQNSF